MGQGNMKIRDCHLFSFLGALLVISLFFATACDDVAPNEPGSGSNAETVEEMPSPTSAPVTESTLTVADSAGKNLPTTNAMLICTDEMGQQLWRFNSLDQTWQNEEVQFLREPGFTALDMVPVGDELLIYGILQDETDSPRFQAYLWPEMVDQPIIDTESIYRVIPGRTDPTPALTHLYAKLAEKPGTTYQLSVEQCKMEACEFIAVDEVEYLSPYRNQSIFWHTATWDLQLKNSATGSSTLLGTGWYPFWLDENTIGFLSVANAASDLSETQPELVLWRKGTGDEVILTTVQVREYLIEQNAVEEANEIILYKAIGTPTHPNLTLLTAVDPSNLLTIFLLELNTEIGSLRYIPELTGLSLAHLELTADGEFLVVWGNNSVQLYSLATGEIVEYAKVPNGLGYAYLTDGEWFLLPAGSTTYFAQPSEDVVEEINLAGQYCTMGAWLESAPK